jgi:uncharacterized protein YdhG (YjbR/CyaY superfamily)
MQRIPAKDIDEYIAAFSGKVQSNLVKLRATIKKAAPKAEEKMSYAIPTFFLGGKNLVHFAAYKNHIGFYPAPSAITAFSKELKEYKTSKGAIQFPVDKPLPLTLISKIVKYRVQENTALAAGKKKKQS